MTICRPPSILLVQLLFGITLAASAGCTAFEQNLAGLFGPLNEGPLVAVQPTSPSGVPAFTVELREANESPAQLSVALDRVLHIQDALVKSGAIDNFRRMNVELYRPLQNGTYHRFEVRYNRSSQRVDPAFDYALQPADRLVVTEDTATVVDDMFGVLTGRLRTDGS